MLCAPVFIFTSGSSALLGHPRYGLSIWLSLLAIFNTLLWVYANLFHEETDKARKYSKSAIFIWNENGRRRLLGAQSINTETGHILASLVFPVSDCSSISAVFLSGTGALLSVTSSSWQEIKKRNGGINLHMSYKIANSNSAVQCMDYIIL